MKEKLVKLYNEFVSKYGKLNSLKNYETISKSDIDAVSIIPKIENFVTSREQIRLQEEEETKAQTWEGAGVYDRTIMPYEVTETKEDLEKLIPKYVPFKNGLIVEYDKENN